MHQERNGSSLLDRCLGGISLSICKLLSTVHGNPLSEPSAVTEHRQHQSSGCDYFWWNEGAQWHSQIHFSLESNEIPAWGTSVSSWLHRRWTRQRVVMWKTPQSQFPELEKLGFQNKTHPNPTAEQHWNSCLATAVFAGLGQRCGNTTSSNCTKNFQMMQKQRQRCCSWGQDRPVTLGFEQEPQVL